jgi:hypothetical protein
VFVLDLGSRDELNFLSKRRRISQPILPLRRTSTMKIPHHVSVFRRLSEPPDPNIVQMLELMIDYRKTTRGRVDAAGGWIEPALWK